jgi:D-glycero-alpha-D-manno-heptose 1-phosphate guanylyltransferase
MVRLLDDAGTDGALLSVRVTDATRFGSVTVSGDGRLCGFVEKQASSGQVNGGVYLFRRATIAQFPRIRPLSFEHDVFPALLARRARITVLACDAPFLDIGTEDSLAQADAFVRAHGRWFS